MTTNLEISNAWMKGYQAGLREMKERCAHVADEHARKNQSTMGCNPFAQARLRECADAIRAMKDEP